MDNLLYNMKLHTTLHFNDFAITRVPGGWIYLLTEFENNCSVFVPYNNEFYVK